MRTNGLMRFKRGFVLAAAAVAALVIAVPAFAGDVYSGYTKVGSVRASYGGRYEVYEGYSKIGYVKASSSGRWDVYSGYSRVGYAKASYGGRYDIFSGYSRVGYARASYGGSWGIYEGSKIGEVRGSSGGPAAGAALLLLM